VTIGTQHPSQSTVSSAVAYIAMLSVAAAVFAAVRAAGRTLTAPAPIAIPAAAAAGATAPGGDALLHVLLTLTAVLIIGRLLGRLLVVVRQPPVIGEVLAGIILGPSLLGRLSP